MFDSCKSCNKKRYIVNKTHYLCDDCNCIRLHGKNRFELNVEKSKSYKNKKTTEVKERDERWYEHLFTHNPNECNECAAPLNNKFRDDKGKIIMRYQYSHIYTKGAYPQFRWHKKNGERLCWGCHQKWEFGDRENMNIFIKNKELIVILRENPNNLVL